MLGNFFRRSTDHMQRVNKTQNVKIDSAASSGGQREKIKYVSFPWIPLEAALSIRNVSYFVKKKFENELIKKETVETCLQKMSTFKISVQ